MSAGDPAIGRFRPRRVDDAPPSASLVEALTPWIVDASRPFADWYFGEPNVAAEILGEWIVRPTSEVFVGRALIAEDAGGLATGCVIAMPGAELATCRAADFATFCAELGTVPEADEVVTDVLAASHELFPAVADDELYISRVAVDPARRGHGIGRALIVRVMDEFRDQGLRRCRLDVSADNAAAIAAYEAAGLLVTATSHSELAGLTYCAMSASL